MIPFPIPLFEELSRRFFDRFGVGCAVVHNGSVVADFDTGYPWTDAGRREMTLEHMISESVRWGEPHITIDKTGAFVWCVPVFLNNEPVAGLFSALSRDGIDERGARFVHDAAWELLEIAESTNICNKALMHHNRMAALADARRAEALHVTKQFKNPRDIYLIEEEKLLRAVRQKDLDLAREIINNVLLGVYQMGNRRFELLKPLVLEMVVQMYRAAVEEGADPTELLGHNSGLLIDLLSVEDEYTLSRWLTRWLEIFVHTGFGEKPRQLPRSLSSVILYVKKNLDKPLTRDRVAKACNLSPSYLSRLLKSATGYAFSALLNRARTDYACSLLEHTNLSASEIAFAAGFNDQSYFTRIFKRYQGETPGHYRRAHVNA